MARVAVQDTGHGRSKSRSEEYFSLKNSLIAMAVGALLCGLDSMGGIGRYALQFIAVLAHEIGHAATATFFAAPSFPVIRLDGHAAALHSRQFTTLAVLIWLFLGYMAYTLRKENKPWRVFAGLAIGYPLIAFFSIWHAVFLLAGHGGEMALAGIFFWRAWTGGFTHSLQERYAYASLAWFLAINSLIFHFRLLTSEAFRLRYGGNGSFGLENDYIRVARDHFDVSLETVAGGMFLVNLIVLPLVVWLAIRRS